MRVCASVELFLRTLSELATPAWRQDGVESFSDSHGWEHWREWSECPVDWN
jgi:hypothetical protein